MSASDLNRMQAALLKAKLLGSADVARLEKEYAEAEARFNDAPSGDVAASAERVELLPTLDGRGRLYDIGQGGETPEKPAGPGNRRKKEPKVQTRDPKTGDMLRLNADDDTTSLGELVRQERFGAGSADQKNLDAEMASRIMTDSRYEARLGFSKWDENALLMRASFADAERS